MKEYPVFISSSDSYSDLWPIFFDMFRKYWPEFSGTIYLNTEEKVFTYPGLNIICTKVGKSGKFGQTFRAGLDSFESERIMLIMIDYLFKARVNNCKIDEYYNYFLDNNYDSLCLIYQEYPNKLLSDHHELCRVLSPAPHLMFSYQIAFWKKSALHQMMLPHENPWTSEWYGTLRAEKIGLRLASVSDKKYNTVLYDMAGCLHKGKWLDDAISHLDKIQYVVDYKKRGLYLDTSGTHKTRLKVKLMLIKDGIAGSYWDLLKRKKPV